jgi:hypothetical protein
VVVADTVNLELEAMLVDAVTLDTMTRLMVEILVEGSVGVIRMTQLPDRHLLLQPFQPLLPFQTTLPRKRPSRRKRRRCLSKQKHQHQQRLVSTSIRIVVFLSDSLRRIDV